MPIVLAPLGIIVAGFVMLGLALTLNQWLRPLLDSLAHPRGALWKRIAFAPLVTVFKAASWAEKRTRAYISHAAGGHLPALVRWFLGLSMVGILQAREIANLATDVAHAFDDLIHKRIPRDVARKTAPIDARAKAAQKSAQRSISLSQRNRRALLTGLAVLGSAAAVLKNRVQGIDRLLRKDVIPRTKATERAVNDVKTRDIPQGKARTKALEGDLAKVKARARAVEKALALALGGTIVFRILARVAPWLFCRNWKILGRAVCGMNANALNNFLALLLGAGLLIRSFDELAHYAEAVTEEVTRQGARLLGVNLPSGRFTQD